ncbi:thioesterase family protein [Sphingomonas bacterium]|uniref:thioesterase family protein n=1 Tax=Sphingomonas bacterium TaxID=1895847 RepID=UPI001576BC05|nr:thioesterase family protein [Sphingomonas bacterium]
MRSLPQILAVAEPIEGGFAVDIPANWLQGRTAYGGLSSALALHAAQSSDVDLPPLRSAIVSFVGPLSGRVAVTATLLRRGRNAAFVQADIVSDKGLGFRATFVFMADQVSRIAHDGRVAERHTPPAADATLYVGPTDFFTGNFEFLDIKDGTGPAEWRRWGRLRDRAGLDPLVELITMADALPPAAFKLLGKDFVPISSLTWQINMLEPRPATTDGWWLLGATADYAANGCSSQTMRVWNADGLLLAEGMQSVAIFG